MKGISDGIRQFLNARGGQRQRMIIKLWEHWDMVMGPDIAPLAFPLGRRKETLMVGAEDNMAAQDLSYMTPEILERANAFMLDEPQPVFTKVQVHLFMGRVPMDLRRLSVLEPSRTPLPPRPENLGNLGESLDPNTAVGRCYRKYVQMYDELEPVEKPTAVRGNSPYPPYIPWKVKK